MNVTVKRIWWGWSMVVAFVLLILLGSWARLGHAAEPVAPSRVFFGAGGQVTGDTAAAIGNINGSLYEVVPDVEVVVTGGVGLGDPEGVYNSGTFNLGGGVAFWRAIQPTWAWSQKAHRMGYALLVNPMRLAEVMGGSPAPAQTAARPVAPALTGLHAAINRPPVAGL